MIDLRYNGRQSMDEIAAALSWTPASIKVALSRARRTSGGLRWPQASPEEEGPAMNLDHFDELLDAYLLGELSQEQAAQLQEALQTDPAARSRFVQSIFIETGLHHLARSEPASLAPRPQRTPAAGARRHMTPGGIVRLRRLAVAAVVLVAIGAIAVFYFARQDSSTLARVASGNVLVDGQSRDRIPEGSTLSVTGPAPAVIHLSDGSLATLDPATQLTLRGRVDSTRQVLHLTAGGGQFQVPYGGGQFRIDTPAGSVTVLGTEFTAVLRSPRSLFLSVAAGTVRFDGEGKTFTLSTGQSRTFGPEPDTAAPQRAGREDREAPGHGRLDPLGGPEGRELRARVARTRARRRSGLV